MPETIFDFPYKILTYVGLWAVQSKARHIRFLYFLYQCWTFFHLFMFITLLLWELYYVRSSVHKSSTNLSVTITILILLWKNIRCLQKVEELRQLQNTLNSGLHPKEDERDRQIMRKAAKDIKMSCVAVYLMGVSTITAWLIAGLVQADDTEEGSLPLPVFIPWNHRRTPFYELSLAFQIYVGYLSTFDVLSLNLTIFGTIVQICAEFDVLLKNTGVINEWFCSLKGGKGSARALNEEQNKEVRRMLVRNIQHHQKIIDCANEAENCYTHMMLVQFVGSGTLLTVISLDLILVTQELNSRMCPLIIFLALAISDIYLFCYFGSRLIHKSHELLSALYGTPWEAMNSSNREIILIMIMKAQRPPKLTIEKFADIDLYSLIAIIKIFYNTLYLLLHLAKNRQ